MRLNKEKKQTMMMNVMKSLVGLLHGIPAARAAKERAEAACKWLDFLERLWKFLKDTGFSEEDARRIIGHYIQSAPDKHLQEMVGQVMEDPIEERE